MALCLAVSLLWLGGVVPEARAATHALVFLGCLGAATLPSALLEHAGRVRRLALGFSALLLAVLVGLLPVPHSLLRWLAPGTAAGFPDGRWWTLSLVPEATVGEAAYVSLLLGMAVLAGTWGSVRWRRSEVERAALLFVAALILVGAGHLWSGETSLFGYLPTSLVVRGTYFAPFVNPNHFAAALLVGLPIVGGLVLRERRWSGWWAVACCTLAGALGLLVYARSRGAVVALCLVLLLSTVRIGRHHTRGRAVALAGVGAAVVVAAGVLVRAGTGSVSLQARIAMWWQSISALRDSWFAGTGGGTFEQAISPYRADNVDVGWAHLHNDPLEWVVETGLVGAVAMCVAAWLLWPRASNAPDRAYWLGLGLLAVLVHSFVEFPMQMPGIALAVVTLLALRRTVFEDRVTISAFWVRVALLGAAALQVAGGLWMVRTSYAQRSARAVQDWTQDAEAAREGAAMLRRVAPWRPEVDLFQGWEALAARDTALAADHARRVAAAHPHDARALRQAALILASAGERDDASTVLERAAQRAPDDWRTAVARARILAASGGDAVGAWEHALREGAPGGYLEEALEALPEGLVWLDAVRDRPSGMSRRLADLLVQRGDLETALLAHEQAAALAPVVLRYHPSHIALLLRLERLVEAERLVREALQSHPDDGRYLELLGDALDRQGRHGDAVEIYIAASTSRASARVRAVRAAEREGGLQGALRIARRLELLGVDDAPTRLEIARARRDGGDLAGCVHDVESADLTRVKALESRARKLLRECGGR